MDEIEAHRVQRWGAVEFLVPSDGPYEPTLKPREIVDEELNSRYLARIR